MEGIDKSVQVVSVTASGIERFFALSGKALRGAKNLTAGIYKLFRFLYSLTEGKPGYALCAASVKAEKINEFKNAMKEAGVKIKEGSPLKDGSIPVFYTEKDSMQIDHYISKHYNQAEYLTLTAIADRMSLSEILRNKGISMDGRTAVEIDKKQIAGRTGDMVHIKGADGNTLDINVKDIYKINGEFCIRADKSAGIKNFSKESYRLQLKHPGSGRSFRYKNEKLICRPNVKKVRTIKSFRKGK